MNSKELRKATKRKLKELGISRRRKFITLICKDCKLEERIRVNNPEIYDEKVKNNHICWKCESVDSFVKHKK